MNIKISIIIPFYKGNKYLIQLLKSIEKVILRVKTMASFEVVIVNDSPEVKVVLPEYKADNLVIKIIENPQNLGIQRARIHGLQYSSGEWIIFLDQDDELLEEGFEKQIRLTEKADVVVGNGRYILGGIDKKIYANLKSMKFLIQEKNFIRIRNLIPSPGECLIRKDSIPASWTENKLTHNGSDDWLLWILLFKKKARFVCNEKQVYIHNDTGGENLSANLDKMKLSSEEMFNILRECQILNLKEQKQLYHAIYFKYYQDTGQLSILKILKYIDAVSANIKYRLRLNYLEIMK